MFRHDTNAVMSIIFALVAFCQKSSSAAFITCNQHCQAGNHRRLSPAYSAASTKENLTEKPKIISRKTTKSKGARKAGSKSNGPGPSVVPAKSTKTKAAKGSTSTTAKKSITTKGQQKTGKSRTKNGKQAAGPAHWLVELDECKIEYDSSTNTDGVSLLHFKIRGNPRPLRRHRTSSGRIYNPSEKLQESFRDAVRELLFSNDRMLYSPIFRTEEILAMTIIFRLKRPKKHFIGGKPGPDRMREIAPPQTAQTRTDVDNLAKFVFDSMNNILYQDDRQIMSLQVTKVLDNEGMCEGSTEILLRSIKDKDVPDLIDKSLEL